MENLLTIIWSFPSLDKETDFSPFKTAIKELGIPNNAQMIAIKSSLTTPMIGVPAKMERDKSQIDLAEFNSATRSLEQWLNDFTTLLQADAIPDNILPVLTSLLPNDKKLLEALDDKLKNITNDALRIYDEKHDIHKLFTLVGMAIAHKKLNPSIENDMNNSFKDKNEYILMQAQHELANYQFQITAKIIQSQKESNAKNLSTYKEQFKIIRQASKKLSDTKTTSANEKLKNAASVLSENSNILRKDTSGFGKSILRKLAKIFSFIKVKSVSKTQRLYDNTNKFFTESQKNADPENKEANDTKPLSIKH